MKTTHTPGPWRVSESLHGRSVWHGEPDQGAAIATIWRAGFDDSHLEANARLIAAAPDLLEALRDCITSEGATCFGDVEAHPEWMQHRLYAISDLARAAIAKAEGQ